MTKRTLLQQLRQLTSLRPLSGLYNKNTSDNTSANRGAYAESVAREYLQQHGLSFISANYFCKGGEIDLVMRDKHCLVFVEVRHRASHRYGSAAESVDNRKQKKLRHAAEHYLQQHPHSGSCRFDVIAMTGPVTHDNIDWIKNAF